MSELKKNHPIKKLISFVRASRRALVGEAGLSVSKARDIFFSRLMERALAERLALLSSNDESDESPPSWLHMLDPLPDCVVRARGEEGRAIEIPLEISRMFVDDSTNLGWAYQFWNEAERDDTTWAISRRDDDHSTTSIPAATQIFTEDYMARFVVRRCLSAQRESGNSTIPSVLDPACGAGHILVHAARAMADQTTAVRFDVARALHGCDIDSDAVDICRVVVLLELSPGSPESVRDVWAVLVKNVRALEGPRGTLEREPVDAVLARTYSCVLTNPPYIGRRKMPTELRNFLQREYPETWMDLCSAFMQRCVELTEPGGMIGLVTVDKWLRLKGYEPLRTGGKGIYRALTLDVVCELGQRAFSPWSSLHDGVGIALLTARRAEPTVNHRFHFVSFSDLKSPHDKERALIEWLSSHTANLGIPQRNLLNSESSTAFVQKSGLPSTLLVASRSVSDRAQVIVGLQTSDDQRFVRYVWSVPPDRERWRVHGKGGGNDRWYGLNRFLLDWGEGRPVFELDPKSGLNVESWFSEEGWTYSWFANGTLALRRKERGWSFGRAASSGFFCDDPRLPAFLNSRVASLAARRQGGKAQLPEGVVRSLPLPDSLEPIDARLVDTAVALKRVLTERDITDATYQPTDAFDPLVLIRAQALLLVVEGELERQVVQCLKMSESESRSLDGVMGRPVSWTQGEPTEPPDILWSSLPEDLMTLRLGAVSSQGGSHSFADCVDRVRGYFEACPRSDAARRALTGGALVEMICRSTGLHPFDVARAMEALLQRNAHVRREVVGPWLRARIVEEALTALGHQWWSVTDRYDPSRHASMSGKELSERIQARLPFVDYSEILGEELPVWIATTMESYQRRLLLNTSLLLVSGKGQASDVIFSHRWSGAPLLERSALASRALARRAEGSYRL